MWKLSPKFSKIFQIFLPSLNTAGCMTTPEVIDGIRNWPWGWGHCKSRDSHGMKWMAWNANLLQLGSTRPSTVHRRFFRLPRRSVFLHFLSLRLPCTDGSELRLCIVASPASFFWVNFPFLIGNSNRSFSPFFGSFESPFRRTWFIVAGDAATNISGFMKSSMLNPSLSEGNFFRSGTD